VVFLSTHGTGHTQPDWNPARPIAGCIILRAGSSGACWEQSRLGNKGVLFNSTRGVPLLAGLSSSETRALRTDHQDTKDLLGKVTPLPQQ